MGFYQIASRVEEVSNLDRNAFLDHVFALALAVSRNFSTLWQVYEVRMPDSVRAVLSVFRILISFGESQHIDHISKLGLPDASRPSGIMVWRDTGLGSVNDVLTCIGIDGFYMRLWFWLILPIGLVALVALSCAVVRGASTLDVPHSVLLVDCFRGEQLSHTTKIHPQFLRCKNELSPKRFFLAALPLVLRLFFLLYPLVTQVRTYRKDTLFAFGGYHLWALITGNLTNLADGL